MSDLLKLSGMKYSSGNYTRQKWKKLVGVDPAKCKEIKITSSGLCVWTEEAERKCQAYYTQVKQSWHSIGVAC